MAGTIHQTLTALLFLSLFQIGSAHSQSDPLHGVIVDAESGLRLGQSTVEVLSPAENRSALRSDSLGSFIVKARHVPFSLRVSRDGYTSRQIQIHEIQSDTIRVALQPVTYSLGEVVVTATRRESFERQAPSSVSVLSRTTIEQKPGSSLGASLEGISSLFVRPYGGAASIQTVALRGLSSEHTLVLVDGQRYNNLQIGLVDFGLFPSANIERVEIVKGGLSALYGADAVGGAINVITRKPTDALSAGAATSIGSSGFSAQQLHVSGTEGAMGWNAIFRQERGSGNYQFKDGPEAALFRRNGADFALLMTDARLDYAGSERTNSSISVSYLDGDRGVPGSFVDVSSGGRARQGDEVVRTQLAFDWRPNAVVTGTVRSSFLYSRETYNDPLLVINGSPLLSTHTNRAFWVTPEARFVFSPHFSGTAGAEVSGGWLRSSEAYDATRWQQSLFFATQHTIPLEPGTPYEIIVYPSLRYDHFTDVEGDLSPKVGINIGILKDPMLRFRSSYGRSFRVPTFNELYWKDGGNPLLKPERSRSFDAGLLSTFSLLGSMTVDVGYFSIVTSDRIVWIPGSGGIWSPRNIENVESEGFEAEGTWKGFGDMIVLQLNATWDRVKKRSRDFPGDPTENKFLPHLPQQTVNAIAVVRLDPISLYVQHSWVSFRFVDEINSEALPGYPLTSASIRYSLSLWNVTASLKLEGTNLFNTSYQVIAHYPMPLREFRATIGAEL